LADNPHVCDAYGSFLYLWLWFNQKHKCSK
jgi:hypothetical protein